MSNSGKSSGTSLEVLPGTMRKTALSIGLIVFTMFPLAAAVSPASTQVVAVPEPGLLVMVGTGLLGLASVVRRTTGV